MDIDLTLLIQLGLFLILFVSLTNIVIRPFMRVLDTRYERLEGSRVEAERLERLAEENRAAYQARISEARAVARKERESLRSQASEEARKLLADVRAEIANKLNATRDDVRRAESAAREKLAADTEAMAKSLAKKIVGREVTS